MTWKFFVGLFLGFIAGPVWAQSGGGDSPQWEGGVLAGKILPHQIDGVSEIMSLGGVQLAYRLVPMTYVESFFHMGNGEGQSWKNLGVSFRMDQPVEGVILNASAGAHYTMSEGPSSSEGKDFGGHVGGGLMTGIGGPTWFKLGMDFSFGPGTSLFIYMALMLRY